MFATELFIPSDKLLNKKRVKRQKYSLSSKNSRSQESEQAPLYPVGTLAVLPSIAIHDTNPHLAASVLRTGSQKRPPTTASSPAITAGHRGGKQLQGAAHAARLTLAGCKLPKSAASGRYTYRSDGLGRRHSRCRCAAVVSHAEARPAV